MASAGLRLPAARRRSRVAWRLLARRPGGGSRPGALGGKTEAGPGSRPLRELRAARSVLLDLTPRQILPIAGDALPLRYRRALARYRYGPGIFKLDYALDGPIPWTASACRKAGTVHLGGTLEEISAAESEVARGRHP